MALLADIKGVGLGLKRELIPQIQHLFNEQNQESSIANRSEERRVGKEC